MLRISWRSPIFRGRGAVAIVGDEQGRRATEQIEPECDGLQREIVYEETLDPLAAAPVPPLGRLVGSRLEVLRSASGAPLTTLRHGQSSASAYTIDSARTSAADP